tara:strand:- start:25 stop:612 length:588 start_codon:yes stop_codon:yes gene_type:complete
MAIIYTYDTTFPESDDLLLGTERNATLRQPTKNFKVADLAKFIINTFNGTDLAIPLFFDITDPVTGRVDTELKDSILSQNAYPGGNTITVAGNLKVNAAIVDSTGKTGTTGQVLTSTVTGTSWENMVDSSGVYPFIASTSPFVITINHPGTWGDYPSVTVVDNNKIVVLGEVRYISTTQLTLTFTATFSGTAYLN